MSVRTGRSKYASNVRADDLLIRIRDRAPAFDPTAYPAPDLTVPLEQRKPGGFGIYLMRQVMDDVSYRRMPDGRNELLLVRRSAFDRESSRTV